MRRQDISLHELEGRRLLKFDGNRVIRFELQSFDILEQHLRFSHGQRVRGEHLLEERGIGHELPDIHFDESHR